MMELDTICTLFKIPNFFAPASNPFKLFVNKITSFEEVVEVYRLTGDTDYIVKVLTNSIEEYDSFNQKLINDVSFRSLKSNIVLKEIKNNTMLPLKHVG